MPNQSDPWYTRTEFWATLGNVVMQFAGVLKFAVPPPFGLALAGLGSMVYTFGRGNVKANQAAAAASALGQALSGQK